GVGARQAIHALREGYDLGLLTLDGGAHLLDRSLVLGESGDLLRIDLRVRELVRAHLADTGLAGVEAREQDADLRLNGLELARRIRFGLGDVRYRPLLVGLEADVGEVLI